LEIALDREQGVWRGLARLVPGLRSSSSGRVACARYIDPDPSASIAGTVCPSISRSASIAGTVCPSISKVQDRKAPCVTSIVQVAVNIYDIQADETKYWVSNMPLNQPSSYSLIARAWVELGKQLPLAVKSNVEAEDIHSAMSRLVG